jgi:hypothetical protein
MACFLNPSLWIYIIVLIALVSIIKIVFPWFVGFFQIPAPLGQILMIVMWAVIAIAGVYFLFQLFSCVFSGGLPSLGAPLHR